MVKTWFVVGIMVLLACWLVAGCGIPQEEYDAVVAEADAVKAKIPPLESELNEMRSEVSTAKSHCASVQNELTAIKSTLVSTQSELATAKSEASSAQSQLSSVRSQISSLHSDLSAVQSDIKIAEAKIAELEAAIAAAEEAAAAEEEEVAEEEIPPLLIGGIQLCSNPPSGEGCKLQPGATFDRGDTVYFYFQVFEPVSKLRSNGRYEVWLVASGKLYGPDGKEVPDTAKSGLYHKTDLEYPPLFIYSSLNYESKADDEPGQYRFEFTVTDMQSLAKGTASGTFTLR